MAELRQLKKIADKQTLGALSFLLGLAIAQLEEASPTPDMRGPPG